MATAPANELREPHLLVVDDDVEITALIRRYFTAQQFRVSCACDGDGMREVLAGGAILTGMILGAVGAFIIDKKYTEASAFAAAGAVLTFFGFMHGESVGFAVTPSVALAYAMVATFLFALSRAPAVENAAVPIKEVPAGVPAE